VLRVIDSHAPPASSPPPAAGIASSEWMHAGVSAATALERECECTMRQVRVLLAGSSERSEKKTQRSKHKRTRVSPY